MVETETNDCPEPIGRQHGKKMPDVCPTLSPAERVTQNMRPAPHDDTTVSKEELSDILAEATGTTAGEIKQGADELELAPPGKAAVVCRPDE